MARFDSLPADQKAVLQLLLKQGKSYDDLAGLLRTSPEQVRERALMALDALGPGEGTDLSDDQVDDLADYLLGQQSASGRASSRDFLEASASGRAWARGVAGELREIAPDAIPEVPSEPAEVDEAFGALDDRRRARREQASTSRKGGVVLLAGAGLLLAFIVLVLTGVIGGDDDDGGDRASTTATSTAPAGQPTVEAQINLAAENEESDALGVANIVSQDGQRALAVIAQDLQPSRRYAVWLYTSPSQAQFLGFAPPVTGEGEAAGRLQGLAPIPENAAEFEQIVLTRETEDQPDTPGTIVLRGSLADATTPPPAEGGAAPPAEGAAPPAGTTPATPPAETTP